MTPKLTDEMRDALQKSSGEPLKIADDVTQSEYVLLPLADYERMQSWLADDGFDVTDAYAAQIAAAAATGWDDPEMDAYDDYDSHRPSP